MRARDANDLCMVPCLCQVKENSLAYVVVKAQVRQSPDIPLGCFGQNSKNCYVSNQHESPRFVLSSWVFCSKNQTFLLSLQLLSKLL